MGRQLRRAATWAVGVVVGSLLAAGCGDGRTTAGPDGSRTPSGSVASPSASAKPGWPSGLTSTAAVTATFGPQSGPAVLVAVDTYPGEGVDHIVLSFRGRRAAPCVAGFVNGPESGSAGRRVTVSGKAFLRIRCRQVRGVALGRSSGLRSGVGRFRPEGTPNVLEVVRAAYRGSVFLLVVGLRHVAPIAGGMYTGGSNTILDFGVGQ